ncbi:MFS general substrate transporter [Aureobasidium subglaciale]|nr:MFS general substrate transporter [Aureobasidium subglaciale]
METEYHNDMPHSCEARDLIVLNKNSTHPQCFSKTKKLYVALTVGLLMFNSTLSSSLPGGSSFYIASYFGIVEPLQQILVSTTYLVGYIIGPLISAPMSEHFGRKKLLLATGGLFLIMSLACIFSPSYNALLVFRFFAGMGGSAPISVIGGVYADLYSKPRSRGTATAAYTMGTTLGTVLGPTIFDYLAYYNWRLSFVLTTALAAVAFTGTTIMPETYLPVLEQTQAHKARCSKTCRVFVSQKDLDERSLRIILLTSIRRPLELFAAEAIVFFSSLYCALVFAILFVFFAAYPYIFRTVYGMDHRTAGLAFIPIGVGTVLSMPLCMAYDAFREKNLKDGKKWALKEEYRRLPLVCVGGVLLVVSLFLLGWTSSPSFHWIIPMMSGLPFGIAFNLILIALFNYLTDSYGIYSASALAAASCARSLLGAILPLAQDSMYTTLGIGWATSILGIASVALFPLPFIFIVFGPQIRLRSPFCQATQQFR